MHWIDRRIAWALAEGPVVRLALFRIIVALMAMRHLIVFARSWALEGFYGDTFYLPYTDAIPQPNEVVYFLVLAGGMLSAAFLLVGYKTRAAAVVCFLLVAYHFSLNEIWYRHNRYFVVLSLFLVCLSPSERVLSVDSRRRTLPSFGPLWTEFLIKAQMTLIYLGSAISKSVNPVWRGGEILKGRDINELWEGGMPQFVTSLIPTELVVRLVTIQALLSEFFLAIFVWFPRTRRFALWWGICFHGFIEVRYMVLTFSYLTLATYFVFAQLRCGEKVWVVPQSSRWSARLVPLLDWLFQFRLASHEGRGHVFVDSNGTVARGAMAWIMLGANLPVFFPICYPLSWLRFFAPRRASDPMETKPVDSPQCSVFWLVACVAFYLGFLATTNLVRSCRLPDATVRFWDLPWYFAMMCLLAACHHRSLAPIDNIRRSPSEPGSN